MVKVPTICGVQIPVRMFNSLEVVLCNVKNVVLPVINTENETNVKPLKSVDVQPGVEYISLKKQIKSKPVVIK